MKIFINGMGVISPAGSGKGVDWSPELPEAVDHQFRCIEPNYRDFIPAPKLRRMSTILKRGNAAAKMCLADAGVEIPDAITVGSGFGCLEDTTNFLMRLAEFNEQSLNPTPFIQSTHNSVAGNIALSLQCHGHNFTFVDGGNSFESALMDAALFVQEHPGSNVLVGGIDEIDTVFHERMNRRGDYWKSDENPNLPIPGEGALFFLVSDQPGGNSYGCLELVENRLGMEFDFNTGLNRVGWNAEEISSVFLGSENMEMKDVPRQHFKNYCGEFHTASAFGLALALEEMQKNSSLEKVLVANNYFDQNTSLLAISSC